MLARVSEPHREDLEQANRSYFECPALMGLS
jgi:hypothetical protein